MRTAPDLEGLVGPVPTFDELWQELHQAAAKTRIHVVNGTSADALEYVDHPDGISVIAIGGDKLSRGLTLEGLCVSYYLRASKMYDTLMQMGRWFGYRPGYLDLCRLYTTNTLIGWYERITAASAELQREFEAMAAVGRTPADFGLRVRQHPDGLLVTSPAKLRTRPEDQHLLQRLDLRDGHLPRSRPSQQLQARCRRSSTDLGPRTTTRQACGSGGMWTRAQILAVLRSGTVPTARHSRPSPRPSPTTSGPGRRRRALRLDRRPGGRAGRLRARDRRADRRPDQADRPQLDHGVRCDTPSAASSAQRTSSSSLSKDSEDLGPGLGGHHRVVGTEPPTQGAETRPPTGPRACGSGTSVTVSRGLSSSTPWTRESWRGLRRRHDPVRRLRRILPGLRPGQARRVPSEHRDSQAGVRLGRRGLR